MRTPGHAIPAARRRARRRGRLREPRLRARGAATATPPSHARSPTGGIAFRTDKDQVIFERDEVLTQAGNAVRRLHAVQERLAQGADARPPADPTRSSRHADALAAPPPARPTASPRSSRWAFGRPTSRRAAWRTGMDGGAALFADFRDAHRPLPRRARLSGRQGTVVPVRAPALRHGVDPRARRLRARALARGRTATGAATWLSELIWRDFYAQILWHHPRVVGARVQAASTMRCAFPNDPAKFAAWCDGRTGYPIVDAAMRQINATGYMHNRLRMIAAVVPRQGPARRLAAGRALLRRHAARLTISRRTTAAGSGRPRPAATRSRTSASSTR